MRLLSLSLRNLRRNPRRSFFTGTSLALSLFLFVSLASVVASLDANLAAVGTLPIAVVLHRAGVSHQLPLRYREQLRALPGVKSVVALTYYGGTYGDSGAARDDIAAMAGDTDEALRTMWGSNLQVNDAEWAAFMSDRTGALVGPQLAKRYGWKAGQRVTLSATLWPRDMTFNVAGTLSFRTDQGMLLFHREYLDQAQGDQGLVTFFWVELDDTTSVPRLAGVIDREFAGAPEPIRTISEQELLKWYLGMAGDVRGLIRFLALLVLVAVFFVTANSIALSTRERTGELAVLKALGFSAVDLVLCLLVEVVALALLGGAVGCTAAFFLFRGNGLALGVGPLSGFHVDPATVAMGFGVAVMLAVLAVVGPGVSAARLRVTDALRREF
jgi:putative ABC transport system permease protein